MNMLTSNLVSDLNTIVSNFKQQAITRRDRYAMGLVVGCKGCITIIELEPDLAAVIDSLTAESDIAKKRIEKSPHAPFVEYERGRIAIFDDVIGSLRSIQDIMNTQWVMTGVVIDPTTQKPIHGDTPTKMWVVNGEDKLRIEEAGKKIYGRNYNYINIEFLPW